jgi:hypothetical protein
MNVKSLQTSKYTNLSTSALMEFRLSTELLLFLSAYPYSHTTPLLPLLLLLLLNLLRLHFLQKPSPLQCRPSALLSPARDLHPSLGGARQSQTSCLKPQILLDYPQRLVPTTRIVLGKGSAYEHWAFSFFRDLMSPDFRTSVAQVGAGIFRGNVVNVAGVFFGFNVNGPVAFWARVVEFVFDNVDIVSLGLRQSNISHGVGDVLRGVAGGVHDIKNHFQGFSLYNSSRESSISRLGDDMETDIHGVCPLLNIFVSPPVSISVSFFERDNNSAFPLFEVCFSLPS